MTSQRVLAEDYAARIHGLGHVSVRPYFGGAALQADGVQFGFVMNGTLYLRADKASRGTFEQHGCGPFSYTGATGQVAVSAYYAAPHEVLEDPDDLSGRGRRNLGSSFKDVMKAGSPRAFANRCRPSNRKDRMR